MKTKKRYIHLKLLKFLVVAFTILLVVEVAFIKKYEKKLYLKTAEEKVIKNSFRIAKDIDEKKESILRNLNVYVQSYEFMNVLTNGEIKKVKENLESLRKSQNLDYLMIFDKKGRCLNYNPDRDFPSFDFFLKNALKGITSNSFIVENDKSFLHFAKNNNKREHLSYKLSFPLKVHNKIDYAIIGGFFLDKESSFFKDLVLDYEAFDLNILDSKKVFSPKEYNKIKYLLNKSIKDGNEIFYADINNERYIFSNIPVKNSIIKYFITHILVSLKVSDDNIISKSLLWNLFSIQIFIYLVILIILYYNTNKFSKFFEEMLFIINEIDTENYNVKFSTKYKNTEFLQFKTKINNTIEKLKNRKDNALLERKELQDRHEIRTQFIANISHEIRTPMTGIVGLLDWFEKTNMSKEQFKNIQLIKNYSLSLLDQINDILDFSKINAGMLELNNKDFNLYETIQEVVSLFAFKVQEKGLEFLVDYDLPKMIKSDQLRIKQIITNLLSNALKFTYRGEILLSLRKTFIDEQMKLEIVVRDTGIGIAEEKIESLFLAFEQTDKNITEEFGGTGLGMTIVKEIVTLMNGNISVKSEVNSGTTFTILVDMKKSEKKLKFEKDFDLDKDLSFYVIDDNINQINLTKKYLKDFKVKSSLNSKDAMFHILNDAKNEKFYDIIFIKKHMNEIGSNELSKKFLKNEKITKHSKIAFIQNKLEKKDEIDEFSEKDLILVKPFFKENIYQIIEKSNSDLYFYSGKNNTMHFKANPEFGKVKIIYADDKIVNREIFKSFFDEQQFIVETAENGKEFLELVKENTYDFVFLDYFMPDFLGYELSQILRNDYRKRYEDVPIISVTGDNSQETRRKSIDSGVDYFLSKPILKTNLSALFEHLDINKTLKKHHITCEDNELFNYNRLFARLSNKKALVEKILKLFIKKIPNDIVSLKKSVKEKNYVDIFNIAHAIKGSSANIDSKILADTSRQIEFYANSKNIEKIEFYTEKFEKHFDLVCEEINKITK